MLRRIVTTYPDIIFRFCIDMKMDIPEFKINTSARMNLLPESRCRDNAGIKAYASDVTRAQKKIGISPKKNADFLFRTPNGIRTRVFTVKRATCICKAILHLQGEPASLVMRSREHEEICQMATEFDEYRLQRRILRTKGLQI